MNYRTVTGLVVHLTLSYLFKTIPLTYHRNVCILSETLVHDYMATVNDQVFTA